jgi:hypothetical protein
MFSSKLFWKVTFYFALLLLILSATTGVTFYFLTQNLKNYSQAAVDMTTTSNLDRMRGLIVDIQSAAEEYMYTSIPEKRTAYDQCWKEFDNEIVALQKSYPDSIDLQTLKQVRTSFYAWVANIGDKKILLGSSGLKGDELGKEIYSLAFSNQPIGILRQLKHLSGRSISSAYHRYQRILKILLIYQKTLNRLSF